MSIRTLIVCISVHHQNTARVANVMANALNADVCDPKDVMIEKLSNYDLIGFGSGIYFGQFHSALRLKISELPDKSMAHRKAFIFSTEGLPSLACLWHWPIKKRLRKKGFNVIGEFCCRGFDTVGPLNLFGGLNRHHPDDRDLANASAFARMLLTKMAGIESSRLV